MKFALVCGMAFRPRLMVLDEPLSGIDPLTRDITQDMYMRKVTKQGAKYQDVEFATIPAVKADGT